VFPPPTPASQSNPTSTPVEFTFFPERERMVAPAADQQLERLSDGRWRIGLELAPDAASNTAPDAESGDTLDGVLRLSGHAYQVRATRQSGPAPLSGEPIGVSVLANVGNGPDASNATKVPAERSLLARLVPPSTPTSSATAPQIAGQAVNSIDPLALGWCSLALCWAVCCST
jgi:hypothetical protein